MTVYDSHLGLVSSAGAARTHEAGQAQPAGRADGKSASDVTPGNGADDVHLSELVRSLRALASESPERQAQIERLARAYADGSYRVDPEAAAMGVIEDALAG